jgi:hypothetical protein
MQKKKKERTKGRKKPKMKERKLTGKLARGVKVKTERAVCNEAARMW